MNSSDIIEVDILPWWLKRLDGNGPGSLPRVWLAAIPKELLEFLVNAGFVLDVNVRIVSFIPHISQLRSCFFQGKDRGLHQYNTV